MFSNHNNHIGLRASSGSTAESCARTGAPAFAKGLMMMTAVERVDTVGDGEQPHGGDYPPTWIAVLAQTRCAHERLEEVAHVGEQTDVFLGCV